jgi:hypothetical protein
MSQIPKVFNAVAAAIEAESIEGKTLDRVVQVTKTLLAGMPAEDANKLYNALPPEQQAAVSAKFN